MKGRCDFSGYATRYNTRCSDGRTIRRGAFADMDGKEIPIVWNHNHDTPSAVIGKGILHSVKDGLRVDGWFSNTKAAKDAKENVLEGVPMTLSIHATNLKQYGTEVAHGIIREVSLVLAGANPGAVIDHVALSHSDGFYSEDEALINWEEPVLFHSLDDEDDEDEYGDDFEDDDFEDEDYDDDDLDDDEDDEEYEDDDEDLDDDEDYDEDDEDDDEDEDYDDDEDLDDEEYNDDYDEEEEDEEMMHAYSGETRQDIINSMSDLQRHVTFGLCALAQVDDSELSHAASDVDMADIDVEAVIAGMDEDQQNVLYTMVSEAANGDDEDDDDEYDDEYDEYDEGGYEMRHNVFDSDLNQDTFTISVDDQRAILSHAMETNCGSFQTALKEYFAENGIDDGDELMHGFTDADMEYLFPDYKDPAGDGEPWTLTRDMTWVDDVINGTHKTPFSRIKTRYIDATGTGIRARGYKKGDLKEEIGDVEVLHRETTPQTIYVKDSLDRDDKVDFTEFGIVAYINKIMTMALKEESAIAILFGDGRDKNDPNKIKEDHIRPIWTDDEVYTIHTTIDLDATRSKLQGTDTGTYFGDSYIWAESFVEASLFAREKYKGSGNLTMYCTPHTRNVMLLARDRNGRRIYDTVNELTAALDVKKIVTVEQMEGLTRTVEENGETVTKKLLAIQVNLADYNIGATKGGEITSFEQFDIDFNKEKYLKEARFSGALTRIKSAIVIEENDSNF